MRVIASLLAASLCAFTVPAGATDVATLLDAADIKYERDGEVIRVLYAFEDDRSQVVFLAPRYTVGKVDVVEIYSGVMRLGDRRISQALGTRLMEENGRRLVGWFGVEEVQGTRMVFCYHNLPAPALDAASLAMVLEVVAAAADEMEKEQVGAGSDEF